MPCGREEAIVSAHCSHFGVLCSSSGKVLGRGSSSFLLTTKLGISDSTLTPLLAEVCRGPVAMHGIAETYYLNFMMCPCQDHPQSMTATFHSKTMEGRDLGLLVIRSQSGSVLKNSQTKTGWMSSGITHTG